MSLHRYHFLCVIGASSLVGISCADEGGCNDKAKAALEEFQRSVPRINALDPINLALAQRCADPETKEKTTHRGSRLESARNSFANTTRPTRECPALRTGSSRVSPTGIARSTTPAMEAITRSSG